MRGTRSCSPCPAQAGTTCSSASGLKRSRLKKQALQHQRAIAALPGVERLAGDFGDVALVPLEGLQQGLGCFEKVVVQVFEALPMDHEFLCNARPGPGEFDTVQALRHRIRDADTSHVFTSVRKPQYGESA